mmetsp:Transcript_39321/g.92148  ORF Transcript_39321/g.92148 Transcript_39321/m.92148 type:complete len:237 (+) Transcript_39321:278-988(+)
MAGLHQGLVGSHIHQHVKCGSGHEQGQEVDPKQVNPGRDQDQDWLHFRSEGSTCQGLQKLTEGASGDLWKHRVERVEEDRVVEVEDGGIHQCDEDKERPLVPQTNGIVYPRAIVIHSVHTPALLLYVVRAKFAHCAADDAHLLEVTLLHEGEILASPLRKEVLHSSSAQAVACCTFTLVQSHRCPVKLGLPGCIMIEAGGDQGLQFIRSWASRIAFFKSFPCLPEKLPLIVVLVLL